jgi:hypothetical protein
VSTRDAYASLTSPDKAVVRQAGLCRQVRLVHQELVFVAPVLVLYGHQLRRRQRTFDAHHVGVPEGDAAGDPPASSGQVGRRGVGPPDLQFVHLGPAVGVGQSVAIWGRCYKKCPP